MNNLKKSTIALISIIGLSSQLLFIDDTYSLDLKDVYNQALAQDKTYQQAKFTYDSAKTAAPIALAGMLPNATLTASTTANKKTDTNNNKFYNSTDGKLTLNQTLFNWGTFQTYSQSRYKVLQAKIAFEIAKQTLISNVVQSYFSVIAAIDNVDYSEINLTQQQENLSLTQAQFKVGLVAKTDVASAKAGYEQAVATLVDAKNKLENQLEALAVITNKDYKYTEFATLRSDFELTKPSPRNIEAWANFASKNNLNVLSAISQVSIDKKQVSIDAGGYLPNASFQATADISKSHASSPASSVKTYTYGATANWNVGSFLTLNDSLGNNTFYSVEKDHLTLRADQAALEQAKREAISSARQFYLTVLSDISQIEAYRQAVVSGEAAVQAAVAKYEAGTETIINVLQQQANLYNNRLSLSNGVNTFFNDRINLKASIGQLSEQDVYVLNKLLVLQDRPQTKSHKKAKNIYMKYKQSSKTEASTQESKKPSNDPEKTRKPKNSQIKNNIKPSKTTVKRPLKQFDKASSHLNEMLIKQDKKELKQLTTKKNMKADDFTHVKSKEQNSPIPSTQSTPSTGGGIHFHTHHHYSK